jgi:hypothetical protein
LFLLRKTNGITDVLKEIETDGIYLVKIQYSIAQICFVWN